MTPTDAGQRAVFLDRDGTINTNPSSGDFCKRADDMKLLPGVAAALRRLCDAGYVAVVYTNQSGVGRGIMTLKDVDAVNARMEELLAEAGVKLAGIYYCPHVNEDKCECRKPKPGLLLKGAREVGIDLARSWAVGDSARDMEAAQAAGCKTVFVYGNAYPGQREKAEQLHPVASVETLSEAADVILGATD
jgi:histidinol-phosphate phosphatase family protein